MKKIQTTLFIFALLFSVALSFAQNEHHKKGEVLIKLKESTNARKWTKKRQFLRGKATNLRLRAKVSTPLNIYKYSFDADIVDENEILASIQNDPQVEIAQFNHKVTLRSSQPDDTDFSKLWHHVNDGTDGIVGADIDTDLAWDITTGGNTIKGDEIVVCVIDGGFDIEHPDLAANIWVNTAEIPNDGIDNDNNGYVDDYRGWNTYLENDDVTDGDDPSHGSAVAGCIGAVGNNNLGVAGVNWKVKMMLVSGGNAYEEDVISDYSYPLAARIRYNETNGQEGAFVVATNSSWGLDFGQASSSPLWCEMYNTMGEVGILSVGATVNDDLNVDLVGDLPASCTSDYLISVTNTDSYDEKVEFAGYGDIHIDLGAPGEDIYSTSDSGGYDTVSGTSFSSPLVAGTIALLYAAPCSDFIDLAKRNPSVAALEVKKFILDGGDELEKLKNLTLTGRRLNVNNSLQLLLDQCQKCVAPSYLKASEISDVRAELSWQLLNVPTSVTLQWRAVGANSWNSVENVTAPHVITGLTACTDYEFQLKSVCDDSESDYSESLIFRTDGCCLNPDDIKIEEATTASLKINWNAILAAQSYNVRLRELGEENWTSKKTETTTADFDGLELCTVYEFQIQTVCISETLEYSDSKLFKTKGCGACTDLVYCKPQHLNSDEEWIKSVVLNTIDNSSTKNGGYTDYTGEISTDLNREGVYELIVEPEFSVAAYEDYLNVFIDYNADGDFDDDGELVFSKESFDSKSAKEITIPKDASIGLTRMRVVMTYDEVFSACEKSENPYGEIEDYCVNIMATASVGNEFLSSKISVSPSPFDAYFDVVIPNSTRIENSMIELINVTGKTIFEREIESHKQLEYHFDTEKLASGSYIVLLSNRGEVVFSKMIIKQ